MLALGQGLGDVGKRADPTVCSIVIPSIEYMTTEYISIELPRVEGL